jgi:iron complex outermembrane receptor protein
MLKTVLINSQSSAGKLSSILSYTGSMNKFIDFTDNEVVYDGNKLPGIPSQSLRLQLTWNTLQILELHSALQYNGKQFLTDANNASANGYYLADLKVSAHIRMKRPGRLSAYTGVNNFTGSKYASMIIPNAVGFGSNEPRFYYPGMPRNWYAGISVSF